jgi:hypothetical protein
MEGLANAKLKNTSCSPLRLTGKPVSLFGFVQCLPFAFSLEVSAIHISSKPLAAASFFPVPARSTRFVLSVFQ